MIEVAAPVAATEAAKVAPALDDMDRDALHAEAARLGVKVHHLAGATKVRAAILEAQAE